MHSLSNKWPKEGDNTKGNGKTLAYKFQSDIESSIDLSEGHLRRKNFRCQDEIYSARGSWYCQEMILWAYRQCDKEKDAINSRNNDGGDIGLCSDERKRWWDWIDVCFKMW